jgi:hypothetical protein
MKEFKMNNKLTMLLAAGALVVGAQSARAVTYLDADDYNPANAVVGGQLILGGGGTFSSSFNIVAPDADDGSFTVNAATLGYTGPTAGDTFTSVTGFNPAIDTVVTGSGAMGFWFRVGPAAEYEVTIEDIALGGNGNGVTLSRNILLQNGLSVNIEASIQATGAVTYKVTNNGSTADELVSPNIRLDYAYLQIDATRQVTTAPDGGATAMLLGLGALGMAGLRRKLS